VLDHEKQEFIGKMEQAIKSLERAYAVFIVGLLLLIYVNFAHPDIWSAPEEGKVVVEELIPEFENGFHIETGLKEGENLHLVIANCTNCHSAKMISQNRASREGWQHMIEWMQETQNLWDLGANETLILDYLASNYAPEKKGRRAPLRDIEWYELED